MVEPVRSGSPPEIVSGWGNRADGPSNEADISVALSKIPYGKDKLKADLVRPADAS
jgi:hypothetical protein